MAITNETAQYPALQGLTPGTWTIDTSHSSVEFAARHVMVSKVKGRFHDFEGAITIAENPLDSKVEATIQLASVDTKDAQRDEHLRSDDFFAVATHPTMTFVSREVRPDGDDFVVVGDLTIRGVTRPVELDLEFNGVSADPWGGTRAGFTAKTEVNRRDFGLEWNVALDTGGVLVGEKVKIELEIEAVRA
jgi:polyisoprenoid-binding protein YceI